MAEVQNYGFLSYQRLDKLPGIRAKHRFDPPTLFDSDVLQRVPWPKRVGRTAKGGIRAPTIARYIEFMRIIDRLQCTSTVAKGGVHAYDITVHARTFGMHKDKGSRLPRASLKLGFERTLSTGKLQAVTVQAAVPALRADAWMAHECTPVRLDADTLAFASEGVSPRYPQKTDMD